MTGHASRATVDFDAFERELRQTSQDAIRAKAPQAAPKGDPLAELARIVGQDDPFRALLEAREKGAAQEAAPVTRASETGRPARVEPTFVDEPAHDPARTQAHAEVHGQTLGQSQSPADAFDQYLASVEQGMYADGTTDPAAFAEADENYRTRPADRPRARNRLVQVGAGLAVVAVCVGGALAWRGTHGGGSGGPITVLADKTPLKVQPTATDGVEIPDQNKQIYDRNAKDGQIKIVNREEQPLDVNQAARTAAARSDGGEPGQGGATPGGTLSDTFGEPRRVRTVSVKPDTPVHQPPAPPAETAQAPVSAIPTMTMPDTAASTATPSSEPRRSASRTLATAPATTPVAEAPPEPQATPAARPKAPQRVASVSPETTASTSEPAPASAALTAPVSGYSVQLGVRGSESEARAAFREMQGKYSQLSGKPELIRQAEVNGKTLFRVRVGPLAKNEASSLCSALQGAGGQCFVAKN
ncbi:MULTISPECIES: SPOR domain-containing protein [Methylobacteriaceae]|uniref:SPOR domain-containing protein n=1 Tax=Methylobacteriaceae TaxID=119045 RepID=UPI00074F8CB7|nr:MULTISPECIES: SPOR domain-containing protein [Methylobacteriaceae]AMB46568.1 sporulation protein [Methylobacterium sp. AMS5]TFZ56281.1 SPOR domain-containing protein [Methylorubrum sp. Q1]